MMDECTDSMAPGTEELLRLALDGEPLQKEASEHLKQCATCQRQLLIYKRAPGQILSKLYRSTCPTTTQLNFYCAGMLSGDEEVGIAYHIAACPLCTSEVVTIRQFLADFEPFPFSQEVAAPKHVLNRIIATLVPWKPQLVARGTVRDTPWPRQYRAAKINISLHLSRGSSGEIILLGLFTSDDPDEAIEEQEGIPVDLYQSIDASTARSANPSIDRSIKQPVQTAQIDDLGNVVFKAVPVGEYVMVVRLPESEIVIEALTIESS